MKEKVVIMQLVIAPAFKEKLPIMYALMSDGSIVSTILHEDYAVDLEWMPENSPIELFNEPNDKPKG